MKRKSLRVKASSGRGNGSRNGSRSPFSYHPPKNDLEAAIHRYIELYDFAPIAYVSFDRSGRIREANLAASQLLGHRRRSLIGRRFALCVADSNKFQQHLVRCRTSADRVETELQLRSRKGDIPAQVSSAPIYSSSTDGAVLYQTAIVDLREREAAEAALRAKEAELDLIVNRTPFMLIRCSRNLRYRYVSRAYAEMVGHAPEEIIGKRLVEIMGRQGFKVIRPYVEAVLSGQTIVYERQVPLRNMNPRFLRGVYAPDTDEQGKVIGWIALLIDISEQKKIEQSLAEAASERETLYRFVQRQHEAKSLRDIYTAALDAILATLCCDRASILLFDSKGVMRFVGWHGLSARYRKAVEGHSPWKAGAQDPPPISVEDVDFANFPESLARAIKVEGIRAAAFIPLVGEGKLIGELMLYYNAPHAFTDKELSLCLSIARQLTLSVERKRADQALRKSKDLLEERVQVRTDALRLANAELKNEINRRKGLEGEILDISDREQQRLGQELHDGLCQQLTAIGFMVRAMALRVKNHRVLDPDELEKIASLVNIAATETRNLARGLHSADVDSAGLPGALETLAKREIWKTPCRLEIKRPFHLEDDIAAGTLYRIAREAVINANKHAQATEISIELDGSPKGIVLSVSDNGVGLSKKAKQVRGLGFRIMNYRARSIGGRLEVEPQKEGGTRVICHVPVRK